jgi:taurine dioxygenase
MNLLGKVDGMARLRIRRLAYALGAEVSGVDLCEQLDDATIAEIRKLWLEHLLLCFPNQELDFAQQAAFARRFGELEVISKENAVAESPHIAMMTEKPVNGKTWHGFKNGQDWHSDNSYSIHPTSAAFLSCKEIPEVGGDTMFANMYRAYEALSPAMQSIVGSLSGIHDRALHRTTIGTIDPEKQSQGLRETQERAATSPRTVHPLVRIHPETRRPALYVGSRVRQIEGMTEEEGRPLIDFLTQHAVSYEFVYRKRWAVNDLIMWDNRCLLHIALCDYDLQHDPRLLIRCAVKGPESGRPYGPADRSPSLATAR